LTVDGYKVWISCLKLLGGEPYPKEIDVAIKTRTFRFLALLSRHSLQKPNPRKERTLALKIAAERHEDDFVIPLNVDGLSPTELDWMTTDLTFIPFHSSWSTGLKQLLKKLETVSCPKPVLSGGAIAVSTYLPDDVVVEAPETLYSNLLPFLELPDVVRAYGFNRPPTPPEKDYLAGNWAAYFDDGYSASFTSPARVIAFEEPPDAMPPNLSLKPVGASMWKDLPTVFGIPSWHVAKPLLRRALVLKCLRLGLTSAEDGTFVYFPSGLLPKNKLAYRSPTGRLPSVSVIGDRTFRGRDKFRYHLGFTFDVLRLSADRIVAKFRLRLRLTDVDGKLLDYASAHARRKSITRTWFNYHFLSRNLALIRFLANGGQHIVLDGVQRAVLHAVPITSLSPRSIHEAALPKGRRPFRRANVEHEPDSIDSVGIDDA
jgi:hypothetical protein